MLVDRETGEDYMPLLHLAEDHARFIVYDSLLSEYAAMGFEYGYSVENPEALVLWEAQFGDFVNGAQSIIDEFISSGELKWGQRSASRCCCRTARRARARTTRRPAWSASCSCAREDNMTVAMPTTPANYFHLLRRQATSPQAQAAGGLHAEVAAAAQGRGVRGRGLHHRRLPAR